MKIRRAIASDLKSVASLFSQYRIFYSQTPDLEGAEKFISERMNNNESVIFVAEDESGRLVGFAQLYPTFSSVSMRRLWTLNDLFVEKENRGKNAAKLLLDQCVAFAKKTNSRGLTLKTAQDNLVAQKLYERNGWKRDNHYLSYNIVV